MAAEVSKSTRKWVLHRDRNTCQAKMLPGRCCETLTMHHLVPRHAGGSNRRTNLLTVCRHHHNGIHDPANAVIVSKHRLLRKREYRPGDIGRLDRDKIVALGLPYAVPNARRIRAEMIASGRVPVPQLPDAVPLVDEWPPKRIRVEPPRTAHGPNGCVYPPYETRRATPPPEEWTDPDTGETYVLTPQGARPAAPAETETEPVDVC